jgi:hypothetical protein
LPLQARPTFDANAWSRLIFSSWRSGHLRKVHVNCTCSCFPCSHLAG